MKALLKNVVVIQLGVCGNFTIPARLVAVLSVNGERFL